MQIKHYEDKISWLDDRRTRITGSKLKDIVIKRGTEKKIGSFQLVADGLGIPPDDENPIERGNRLEPEAIETFEKETGKKVDKSLQMWFRDDNDKIAYSPDGVIGKKECVEVKCLSSARHIEAIIKNEIPDEFEFQKLQAFIVNEALNTLYFVLYDPRLIAKPLFVITVHRKDIQEDIDKYLIYENLELEWVAEQIKKFTF